MSTLSGDEVPEHSLGSALRVDVNSLALSWGTGAERQVQRDPQADRDK